jgi:butyryl-CoA dehydrogenase
MQDRLYHDLTLPDEAQAIRAEVREFANRELAPVAYEIGQMEEAVDNFPREFFRAMGREGLFRIPFKKEDGGRGLKYPACATVATIEELAYFSNSIAAIYDVHCILAGHALEYASEELRRKYMHPLLSGDKIGCFATTEPEASTDLSVRALQTTAEKQGDVYIVNGQKRFITNAPVADFVISLCRTDDTLTTLVIDLDSPGVRVGEPDKKLGNRAQLTADIYFENAPVPVNHVVGDVGRGLRIALALLTYGRVGIAAAGVGMAQSAFDESIAHLKERLAFGKKIAQFQHWQFKMAERATQIENARNLYIKTALLMDQGVEFPDPEAPMAKYYGTELAVDMARDGIQIFGGYGFMRKLAHDQATYKVEEIYRDAKIGEIYEGTNEIQRWIIARKIFGKDLTG